MPHTPPPSPAPKSPPIQLSHHPIPPLPPPSALAALSNSQRASFDLLESCGYSLRAFATKAAISLFDAALFLAQPHIQAAIAEYHALLNQAALVAAAKARLLALDILAQDLATTPNDDRLARRQLAALLIRLASSLPKNKTAPLTPDSSPITPTATTHTTSETLTPVPVTPPAASLPLPHHASPFAPHSFQPLPKHSPRLPLTPSLARTLIEAAGAAPPSPSPSQLLPIPSSPPCPTR